MKKIALFISLFLIAAVLVAAIAAYANDSFDPAEFKMLTSEYVNVNAGARLELSVDFLIESEDIDYLEDHAENLRVYAVMLDYDKTAAVPTDNLGATIEMVRGDSRIIDGISYYKYNLNLGVILPENYNKSYSVRGFVSYELGGEVHKTASDFTAEKNVITPYDRVYSVYCDRSDTKNDTHPYETADGSFSPVEDLNALRKILASTLYLQIKNGEVRDIKENECYKSLYDIEYQDYDGILILSLEGGEDIPEWLLSKLYINGEERYFEIHNGKIKLVV